MGVNLHDLGLGNDFLDTTPKVQAMKEKLNKLDFIIFKNSCIALADMAHGKRAEGQVRSRSGAGWQRSSPGPPSGPCGQASTARQEGGGSVLSGHQYFWQYFLKIV